MSGTPAGSALAVDLGLSVAHGALQLDVRFSIAHPATVLFGPSASGKSTLLRLLAGLLRPDRGSIHLDGTALCDTTAGLFVPAGRRGIGYLTQEPALFPNLSVASNIAFGLHALGRRARDQRLEEMLGAFSLEALAARFPRFLSGGERQRVALARALAPRPRLLLLDEPFSALDPFRREQTNEVLARLLAAQPADARTLLLSVSHDVAEVYAGGAEVLLLDRGKIAGQGPAREVLRGERERLLKKLES